MIYVDQSCYGLNLRNKEKLTLDYFESNKDPSLTRKNLFSFFVRVN